MYLSFKRLHPFGRIKRPWKRSTHHWKKRWPLLISYWPISFGSMDNDIKFGITSLAWILADGKRDAFKINRNSFCQIKKGTLKCMQIVFLWNRTILAIDQNLTFSISDFEMAFNRIPPIGKIVQCSLKILFAKALILQLKLLRKMLTVFKKCVKCSPRKTFATKLSTKMKKTEP